MTVEEIIISYLIDLNIPGIEDRVYAEVPEKPGSAYVTVMRSGGNVKNHIREYLIYTDIRVTKDEKRGKSKLYAVRLHEAVIDAMSRITDETPLFGCHKNADYDATKTDTKEYRYQALWIVYM